MGFITAMDPASKVTSVFGPGSNLHDAIKHYGYKPMRPDGSFYDTVYLQSEDGFLLDGAPFNVFWEGVWYETQKDILEPFYASGQIPRPPLNIQNLPVVSMPADVQASYEAFHAAQASTSPVSTNMILGAGALLAALLFFGGKKTGGASDFGGTF